MKKYQLWLERKTYSQHLHNLLRIKMVSSDRQVNAKYSLPPEKQRTIRQFSHSNSSSKLAQTISPGELSYLVTTRQLQKHKLRLVRSKQIVRENQQMSKRINRIKPFINDKRPIDYTNYKLKRKMERSNESNSGKVNQKNYQKFVKIRTQKVTPNHTHQLTLKIEEIDHRIPPHLFTELWVQILAPSTIAKSQFVKPVDLKKQTFQFTFPKELPDAFTIQLNSYKGLQHIVIGNYEVIRPEQEKTVKQEWPAIGQYGHLRGKITYKSIRPKIWNLKRFKN